MNFYFPSLIMVIGLSACATNYTEISTTEPHAVLNFVNEPNLITRFIPKVEQSYASVRDDTCDMRTKFVNFSSGKKSYKPIRVQSGETMNILAYNVYGGSEGHADENIAIVPGQPSQQCKSIASFTPKKGGNYIIRMKEIEKRQCELFVIDYSTKAAPSDLIVKNHHQCE